MRRSFLFWLGLALFTLPACSIPGLRASLPTPIPETPLVTPVFETPAAAATATLPSMANLDDEEFDSQLVQAVENRDFSVLRALMSDRFSFATWNTELLEVSAEEAMQRLQQTYLAQGSSPAARFGTDVVALLEGTDPLSLWGPVAHPVRALHVMGLGPDGIDEAVLVIGRDAANGGLYWHGILVPPDGYFQASQPLGESVKAVVAKDVLNVRTGPGAEYEVLGLVNPGEVAQVTGKSADGNWWQIVCTQATSGACWITADPALTEPTTTP